MHKLKLCLLRFNYDVTSLLPQLSEYNTHNQSATLHRISHNSHRNSIFLWQDFDYSVLGNKTSDKYVVAIKTPSKWSRFHIFLIVIINNLICGLPRCKKTVEELNWLIWLGHSVHHPLDKISISKSGAENLNTFIFLFLTIVFYSEKK